MRSAARPGARGLERGAWSDEIDHLAAISTKMAGDRGLAFYGDERQALGPQELFDESDASRAVGNLEYAAKLVTRLLAEHGSTPPPSAAGE